MESVVLSRNSLLEPIFSYIQSERILVSAENGNVVLKPVNQSLKASRLRGICPELNLERFLTERRKEEGLDEWVYLY